MDYAFERDDSAYAEQHYWRGRIWAPMNYLVYLGLRRAELKDEAKILAEKSAALLLREWRECGHIHENYHADTGMGCGYDHSDRIYHWGVLLGLVALKNRKTRSEIAQQIRSSTTLFDILWSFYF